MEKCVCMYNIIIIAILRKIIQALVANSKLNVHPTVYY